MLSSKQVPLRLVAHPVRLHLLRRLDRSGPASLGELAEAAEVHVNTARTHLTELEEAGIVARDHVPTGTRGRPPLRYRLVGGWRVPSTDFKGLAELLATSLARLDPSARQLQGLGQDWGRWLAGRPGAHDARELIPPALEALGFEARVEGDVVHLAGCPCRLILPDRPDLLCRLAAAVVDGLVAASREPLQVRAGVHDPDARRCELRLGERRAHHRLLPLRLRRA